MILLNIGQVQLRLTPTNYWRSIGVSESLLAQLDLFSEGRQPWVGHEPVPSSRCPPCDLPPLSPGWIWTTLEITQPSSLGGPEITRECQIDEIKENRHRVDSRTHLPPAQLTKRLGHGSATSFNLLLRGAQTPPIFPSRNTKSVTLLRKKEKSARKKSFS